MEIGTDISKNIQEAIKAKLIELKSYVDDELPDYIMIMIANRKKEEQMTDSLSLFLGNNTKVFTKWLYELLGNLNNKKEDVDDAKTLEQTNNVKESVAQEKEPETKKSKWDIKGEEEAIVGKEAEIEILPESDHALDLELYGMDSGTDSTKKLTSTNVQSTDAKHKKKTDKDEALRIKPTTNYAAAYLNHKKGISKQTTEKSKNKSHKSVSSTVEEKRELLQKRSDDSKEYSHKDKSKKRSRTSKEESVSRKRGNSSSKPVRDWDKHKVDQDAWEEEKQLKSQPKKHLAPKLSRKPDSDDEIVEPSAKRFSSVVQSSISAVKRGYVSEDSDEETKKSSIVSKVALPTRRSRLPPHKQANRSLLLKAVCEAESSVKQSSKISSSIDEKQIVKSVKQRLGRVERREKFLISSANREEGGGDDKQDNKVKVKKVRIIKRKGKDAISKTIRDENIQKTVKNVYVERELSTSPKVKIPKILTDSFDVKEDISITHHKGDKRRFISRKTNKTNNVSSNSVVHQDSENNARVKFDQRNLKLRNSTVQNDDEISLPGTESLTDEVPTESVAQNKKPRSSSPCFIVTLDGSVAKDKTETASIPKQQTKQKFKAIPVKAPADSNEDDSSNQVKSEKSSNVVTDDELISMREKLIKMQNESRRLKSLQQEQLPAIKHKTTVTNILTSAKPDPNKSIHIANVHFSANEKQLTEHFGICGKVRRVTLLKDTYTGHPKGFAYLEFEEQSSVQSALALDNTTFSSRVIRVTPKTSVSPSTSPYKKSTTFTFRSRPVMRPRFQYTARSAMKTFRARYRAIPTRNKTWVKPGFIPT